MPDEWTSHDWSHLGSYVILAMAIAALLFSGSCYFMLRTVLRHVIRFDPQACFEMYQHAMEQQAERRRLTDKIHNDKEHL